MGMLFEVTAIRPLLVRTSPKPVRLILPSMVPVLLMAAAVKPKAGGGAGAGQRERSGASALQQAGVDDVDAAGSLGKYLQGRGARAGGDHAAGVGHRTIAAGAGERANAE